MAIAPYNAPGFVPGVSQTPDVVIEAASNQISAGQPVTALPRQSWDFNQQQAWIARMDEFDRQARVARIARDQAARDAQLLDQMSRVAKSTKDIEVAMQAQDVMGFRNAVASGTPAIQALQRFPRAATSPLVAAMRTGQQATWVPGVQGGAPGHFQLPSGGVTIPPVSLSPRADMPTVAQPVTTPEGEVLGYGAVTGPTTRRIIPKAKSGTLDAAARKEIDLLTREKAALDKEIGGTIWIAQSDEKTGEPLPEYKAQHEAALSRRAFIDKRLGELLPGAYPAAVSTNAPAGTPIKVTSKAQRDTLPKGTIYVGPDGRTYTKQ